LYLKKKKPTIHRANPEGRSVSFNCEGGSVGPLPALGRWRWWGHAAALANSWRLLSNFAKLVDLFNSGSGSAGVMFAIGKALHGRVNEETRTIFKNSYDFDALVAPAKQAIAFYEAQIKATKDAMRAWTLVGVHYGVVKDVRKLIAKLIWDSREEALYDVSERREQDVQEE
jgi:hypothetical protein